MSQFSIFNKSSADMSEVLDNSIDLIYTSPPYNIDTLYGTYSDHLPINVFDEMLSNVFTECERILAKRGVLVIECADTTLSDGTYAEFAARVANVCSKAGLRLIARHVNFIRSEGGVELPDHGWGSDYTTRAPAHSNCHQILVLSKDPNTVFDPQGTILYVNYVSSDAHVCPTPKPLIDFVLDRFFKSGMTVCDPFMGTATFGAEVVRREGRFWGYELDPAIFAAAESALSTTTP